MAKAAQHFCKVTKRKSEGNRVSMIRNGGMREAREAMRRLVEDFPLDAQKQELALKKIQDRLGRDDPKGLESPAISRFMFDHYVIHNSTSFSFYFFDRGSRRHSSEIHYCIHFLFDTRFAPNRDMIE